MVNRNRSNKGGLMEIYKLQQLLSEMSLQEKIGQMVQLTGAYFDKDAVLTGVVGEQLPPEWVIRYAGGAGGTAGADPAGGHPDHSSPSAGQLEPVSRDLAGAKRRVGHRAGAWRVDGDIPG